MLFDALLWNCPGLVAQRVRGVFLIEASGLGLSIPRSLGLSLPSLI